MDKTMDLKGTDISVDNREIVVNEIATEIVNDLILEFCFEAHRAIKLGYHESFFSKENNKHHQESTSVEDGLLESQIDKNEPDVCQECTVSGSQDTVGEKKKYSEENAAEYGLPFVTQISMKDVNITNSLTNYKGDVEKSACFELPEKALHSNSFQSWKQFLTSTQTEEKNAIEDRNTKNNLSYKAVKRPVSGKEEQVGTDIFGKTEKYLRKTINKNTCTCMICKRKVGAVRYAHHLATCMGLGRRRSQRIYYTAKNNKR